MTGRKKTSRTAQFGDFQTPGPLARRVCRFLALRRLAPQSIIEPTCGTGSFLRAAREAFPDASRVVGFDINAEHVRLAETSLSRLPCGGETLLAQADFFAVDWPALVAGCPEPILVLGNPPWVTSAALGSFGGANLPPKSNFQNRPGLAAITGKANFDISEWMLIRLLESLHGRRATLAMLLKTAVARKVLVHAWKERLALARCSMHSIDAETHFGVAVEACLLVCEMEPGGRVVECDVHAGLDDAAPAGRLGLRDGRLLADVKTYEELRHLRGPGPHRWRSGVKHDSSRVMELREEGGRYRNGLGEVVDLELDCLYPMLKSSEVAGGVARPPARWMLVPQTTVGEETSALRERAPRTWQYLLDHGPLLDRRASSIYRKRPRFSVFGVGPYTFAPWKVAISGFYKELRFAVVGPHRGRPVVFDDTVYFLPCETERDARRLASLLESEPARRFLSAMIFWDAKRPITADTLQELDLDALARSVGQVANLPPLSIESR